MRWAGKAACAAVLSAALAGCTPGPRSGMSVDRTFPDSPNMRAVRGQVDDAAPLVPEAGDIWAGIMPDPSAPTPSAARPPHGNEAPEPDIWADIIPKPKPDRPPLATAESTTPRVPPAEAPPSGSDVEPPGSGTQRRPPTVDPVSAPVESPAPQGTGADTKTVATLVVPASPEPPTTPPPTPTVDAPAAPPPAVQVEVQLTEATSEADARAVWSQLEAQVPALLQDHAPEVVQAEANGQPVWRLRTGGFASKAEADAFCAGIRGAGGGCAVVAGGA